MKFKKILVFFNILFIITFLGYSNIKIDAYDSKLDIRGITLKISLIQTAYEIYNVNILNPDIYTEDLYEEFGKDSYNYYKWLKNTYKDMDPKMVKSLETIFKSKDSSEYINSIIKLDDNSDLNTIIFNIINDESLNLTPSLKKDIEKFFNYFYNVYFEDYFNKNKNKFSKKVKNLNKVLNDCNVDIKKITENYSGVKLNNDSKSIFYFNLSPISYYEFDLNNTVISTISLDMNNQDFLSLAFHNYSHLIFSKFKCNYEFNSISNDNSINKNNNSYIENLIEGFSKFLYYQYFKVVYEYNIYEYDLDFYNYLKYIDFNSNKISLKDASITFLKQKN